MVDQRTRYTQIIEPSPTVSVALQKSLDAARRRMRPTVCMKSEYAWTFWKACMKAEKILMDKLLYGEGHASECGQDA
jgi:hypothetical protein